MPGVLTETGTSVAIATLVDASVMLREGSLQRCVTSAETGTTPGMIKDGKVRIFLLVCTLQLHLIKELKISDCLSINFDAQQHFY